MSFSNELMKYFGPEFEYADWEAMLEVLEEYNTSRSGETFYDGDNMYFKRMEADRMVCVGVSYRDLFEVVSISELKASLMRVIDVRQS